MDYQKLETVYEDAECQILSGTGEGDLVLVSFTGIGHALGGIDVQKPEFLSACRFGKTIFVIDKNRSWGNNLDVEFISEIILGLSNNKPIVTLGNSMGGFLCILFSKYLSAKVSLAFAPQWSISSAIVPSEKRWLKYRKKIKKIKHVDLKNSFDPCCKYVIFFGDNEVERVHSDFFEKVDSISVTKIEGVAHDVASHLKKIGMLNSLIENSLASDSIDISFV